MGGAGSPAGSKGMPVICITRLNGSQVYVNAEHIQALEAMPDTHIQLTNGQSYIAREPVPELVERIIAYQRRVRGSDRQLVPVPTDYGDEQTRPTPLLGHG